MNDERRPDYSDLLRSPYDPDPDRDHVEGESDIAWRAPVIAAILGALLVSAYVIYAIVVGPDEVDEAVVETTTTTEATVEYVQSTELPDGFLAASDDVGFRIENVAQVPNLQLAIASAAVGGIESALVTPVDIAYWAVADGDREIPMKLQHGENGSLGNHTVTFGFPDLPPSPEIVGYPAVGEFSVDETLALEMGDLPIEVVGHAIDMGADRSVVIDRLVIGDGWGHVEWSAVGTTAKVDVIVEFSGTDDPGTEEVDPTVLTSSHLRQLRALRGPKSFAPYYNFELADQLDRAGQPLSSENDPTGVEVFLTVTVPASIGDPISLPLPASS